MQDRRDSVATGLIVAAVVLLVLALAVPSAAPSREFSEGSEFWHARRNLAVQAAWLCAAAAVTALASLLVRGADHASGYVGLAVVVLLACGVLAALPGVRECWGYDYISGPFEDDYSCMGLDAAGSASG